MDAFLLDHYFGISPLIARELAFRSVGETDAHLFDLGAVGEDRLWKELSGLIRDIQENHFTPICLKKDGKMADFTYCPIAQDEATAFADPENEHKMQMALQSLIKNKTVIVIAHRLSSIVSAHQIVVMKEGRIVQCGIHDVLSTAEGVYKNMWDAYTNAYQWTLNKN